MGIDNKNKKTFFTGLIISSFARQSSIAIIISILLIKIFKREKFFLSKLNIFFVFYDLCFNIFDWFYLFKSWRSRYYTLGYLFNSFFGIFLENVTFRELLIFLIWPFLSFGPLVIFCIFFVKFNTTFTKDNIYTNIFIFIFSFLIIIQPIISGVYMSGKNIIRLSSFSFLPILIFLLINFELKPIKNLKTLFFLVILSLWTCHPTFSKFEYLEKLKF